MQNKKKFHKKRSLSEVRSYWVGVGMAIGVANSNNVRPYFEKSKYPRSLNAGWEKEVSSRLNANRPSSKANLFK